MTDAGDCDSRLRASFCPKGAPRNLPDKLRSGYRISIYMSGGMLGVRETAGTKSPGPTEGFQVNKLVPRCDISDLHVKWVFIISNETDDYEYWRHLDLYILLTQKSIYFEQVFTITSWILKTISCSSHWQYLFIPLIHYSLKARAARCSSPIQLTAIAPAAPMTIF